MHAPGRHAPNRLALEKSPYLLQHAHNPVDWYPWGEEAFARARAEDKPVFLSIGYSTCHWCHVMERESFMDDAVAALLNEHFVCVKVDREERPDVDRVYMNAMQALGTGGGWPLNAFLTPGLEAFWGGTYFPPDSVHGRPGLKQILPRLVEAWRTRRADVVGTGAQVMQLLADSVVPAGEGVDAATLAARCAEFLEREHDDACGGFGRAPKFPSPGNLWFLLRRWARGAEGAETARRMALAQLEAMRAGGLHDQLGGGFHRYSTDREWLVPHFEKMLYDQALIADACLDAYRATGDERWANTARGVFDYVARDLTSPEGAFLSAEDADSEGAEGTFYVWTPAQFAAVLGPEDGAECARWLGVSAGGNFEHGTSVLHEAVTPPDAAARERLAAARTRLLAARAQRPRPHRDDKVIAAWNGLFIAALANGARVLDDATLAARAARAFDFVWSRMGGAEGALRRRWREGEAACDAQLDDHAALAVAALELFAATHDPLWLERARALVEAMVSRFHDREHGGFFDAPPAEGLPRLKDGFDGAELAGNSLAAEALWRLGTLCERDDLVALAQRSFDFHAARLARAPWAMPRLVGVMERAVRGSRHVVVVGEAENTDTRALLRAFESRLRPDDDLVLVTPATRPALERLAPFAARLPLHEGRATAYVCVDHACRQPVHGPEELAALLEA